MISVYDLYQSFQSYCNTYISGWYRPTTDFLRACNDISIKLWIKWTDEAEKSQQAKDNLLPFLVSKNMMVTQSGPYGTFIPPKDAGKCYERFAAARVIISDGKCYPSKEVDEGECDGFKTDQELAENYYDTVEQWPVTMVDDQKWGAANKHLTKKPTLRRPIMRLVDGKFQVSPRQVSVVVLDFYIRPALATFTYTKSAANLTTGRGDVITPGTNDIPLPWSATLRDEFLIELGERYAMFTRDQFLSQVTQQQKQTA